MTFKILIKSKVLIYLTSLLFITNQAKSQCVITTPSEPTSVTCGCSGGNSITTNNASVTINAGETYCVNSGQSVTGLSVTLNGGTLNICGTAVISTLTLSGSVNSSTFAYIRVGTGGNLTITPNFTLQPYIGILNLGGTLTFNGTITQSQSNSWIITASSSSFTTFNGNYSLGGTSSTYYISRGTTTIAAGTTFELLTNSCTCLEKSNMKLNGTMKMSATNGISFGGTAGQKNAIINYSSTAAITFNSPISGSTDVKFCQGASATNYAPCFGSNNGGTCGSPNSCTSSTAICNWVGAGSASFNSGVCSSPVPVILTNFKANSYNEKTIITWNTVQEVNNDYFIVERSLNGKDFEEIGSVKGNGNSNAPLSYSFQDIELNNNQILYYRLKQIDFDANYQYSNIIALNDYDNENSIEIFPNPSTDNTQIFIQFHEKNIDNAIVNIFDAIGKLLFTTEIKELNNNNLFLIKNSNSILSSGTYLIQVQTNQNIYNNKIIIH